MKKQYSARDTDRPDPVSIEEPLAEVRRLIERSIRRTSLRFVTDRFAADVHGGKMLRARLVLRVAPAAGLALPSALRCAAAVEMLQTASLLHDDVLDGSSRRRGRPAMWVSEGTKAAILVGDLLVSGATEYLLEARPVCLPVLVETLREMCDAEAEQEFRLHGNDQTWERCISIARRKTGSLFGLAAFCAGGEEALLREALRRAGYEAGTAYQIGDDLLDTCAEPDGADKTLGTDARDGKLTAATCRRPAGLDPAAWVNALFEASLRQLDSHAQVARAWRLFVETDLQPALQQSFRRAALTS
jgi:geranylgeranyl pyrophosphate synthase